MISNKQKRKQQNNLLDTSMPAVRGQKPDREVVNKIRLKAMMES